MQKIRTLLGVVTTLAALSACSNPPANLGIDAGMHDAGAATGDTGGATDTGASTGGTCAAPIDLSTAGTALATGTGRTIHTSNAMAPAAPMTGLLNGSCADDGMGGSTATNEVVFRYTVQTGGHIQASTDDPASGTMLDTIVWILDACTDTATELACADDVDYAGGNYLSTGISDAVVSAGTTITIVVAGYMGSTGAFTLNVTEVASHAGGEACDGTNPYCVDGFTCLRDAPGAMTGHCLADGGNNGVCHVTAPFCDTGLQCSVAAPTVDNTGVCQMPIAGGDVCSDTHYVCVTGFSCQMDAGSTTAGHCLADGAEYGACRVTGTACDGTLVCSVMTPTVDANGTCQMPIAGTDPCTTRHSVCVTGFSCQLDEGSTTDGHCLADGAEYGLCRVATPFCDGTLVCSAATPMAGDGSTCQMPIATGGACTPRHYLCVANDTCIPDAGSMTMGHCIADGAMGGACRAAAPECDGTLTCDANGLCN